MSDLEKIWPKRITVDKRIVGVLSQSTYDNFPRALKELITNSYDADASAVEIKIDFDKELIILRDTGRGMDAEDFDFYLKIAGKTRKKENNRTPLGRQIIGQFGVGFLAIFPFFKNYRIESKKVGTNSILTANIPLYKYFSSDNKPVDISSILIDGSVKDEVSRSRQSFTKITLTGFNDLTKSFFFPRVKQKVDKNLVDTYSGIDKLKWILADELPLKFKDNKFNDLFGDYTQLQFDVSVNGEILQREIYGHEVLETHKDDFNQIGNIKFKYCIVTQRKSVKPFRARYLKVRNLNVGIGDERQHFGVEHGATRSRIHWLTGEIHILEGMNDLIKVSRDGFNYSSDYEELKLFFNGRLNYHSNKLEKEAELVREVRQTGKEFRVTNVNLLKPDALIQKVKKFEAEGYNIKQADIKKGDITINDEEKEIDIGRGVAKFEKHIIVKGKRYNVIADSWKSDNPKELFPACKITGNRITINSSYPLFSGRKYADTFIKLHLMLLINYNENKISKALYKHFLSEVLEYYSDYLK